MVGPVILAGAPLAMPRNVGRGQTQVRNRASIQYEKCQLLIHIHNLIHQCCDLISLHYLIYNSKSVLHSNSLIVGILDLDLKCSNQSRKNYLLFIKKHYSKLTGFFELHENLISFNLTLYRSQCGNTLLIQKDDIMMIGQLLYTAPDRIGALVAPPRRFAVEVS